MKTEKTVAQRVKEIIVEQLGVNAEQVVPEAFINGQEPEAQDQPNLGGDSLDVVELMMAVEEEFSIEIPDQEAEKLHTVGDLTKYIEDREQ